MATERREWLPRVCVFQKYVLTLRIAVRRGFFLPTASLSAQMIETVDQIEIEELSGTEYEVESILDFKRVSGRP